MNCCKTFVSLLIVGSVAGACELPSTQLKFQGTAFADLAFQISGQSLDFFKSTKRALSFSYDPRRDRWCYTSSYATSLRPARGCLSLGRKGKNKGKLMVNGHRLAHFVLRDLSNQAIARVRIHGAILRVSFVDEKGRTSGKSLVVTAPRAVDESLQVHAWNCPNSRYLSCVGAELKVKPEIGSDESVTVAEAEMSKRQGYFEVNCSGLREVTQAESQNKKGPITGALSNAINN